MHSVHTKTRPETTCGRSSVKTSMRQAGVLRVQAARSDTKPRQTKEYFCNALTPDLHACCTAGLALLKHLFRGEHSVPRRRTLSQHTWFQLQLAASPISSLSSGSHAAAFETRHAAKQRSHPVEHGADGPVGEKEPKHNDSAKEYSTRVAVRDEQRSSHTLSPRRDDGDVHSNCVLPCSFQLHEHSEKDVVRDNPCRNKLKAGTAHAFCLLSLLRLHCF